MKKLFKFLFLFLSFWLFTGSSASAASLSLHTDTEQIKTGEVFTSTLYLNTEGQSINAIEGDLKYNEDFLKIEAINIGSSFINFWVDKPAVAAPGAVHFSGITPGGISANNGEVFRVVFRGKKEGDANLSLNNVKLFLNDGEGTEAPVEVSNADIKITESREGVLLPIVTTDTVLPEKFVITRTKDPSIYDDKYFVVFSTVDKDSGIDYYEVCELFKCVRGESPFLLKNQTPFYHIVVKAYDMNGNVTASSLTSGWFVLLLFLLFVVILYLCFYLRRNSA